VELTVRVHFEGGAYWAEVQELPGCFASGETLDALKDALEEAIAMYLEDDEASARPDLVEALRQGTRGALQVDEMKVLVPPSE
jgi:predicted RNase H-like HicB family nuclease